MPYQKEYVAKMDSPWQAQALTTLPFCFSLWSLAERKEGKRLYYRLETKHVHIRGTGWAVMLTQTARQSQVAGFAVELVLSIGVQKNTLKLH